MAMRRSEEVCHRRGAARGDRCQLGGRGVPAPGGRTLRLRGALPPAPADAPRGPLRAPLWPPGGGLRALRRRARLPLWDQRVLWPAGI